MKKILLKVSNSTPNPPENEQPITNQTRKDWNDYLAWLETKKLRGKPELDKNNLGIQMIEEYRKVNPNTTITKEMVVPIQKEFQKYREWSLDQVKQGKAQLTPGVTPDNYMKALSIVDGIPGQRTTSFAFPQTYLTQFEDGKNMGTTNQGFATTNK